MAFSDNLEAIKDFAVDAAYMTANKTRVIADIARANVAICKQEEIIKKAQIEIGRICYNDYIAGVKTDHSAYQIHCRNIDVAQRAIADLRDYIDRLKNDQEGE